MECRPGQDYKRGAEVGWDKNELHESDLCRTAKLVYEKCEETGLTTKIRYAHDGIGDSWHEIVLIWDD